DGAFGSLPARFVATGFGTPLRNRAHTVSESLRVIEDAAFHADAAQRLRQRVRSISKGRSEVCRDKAGLLARSVEAKEPRAEQLASRFSGTQDDEYLTLVNGRVLEMCVDKAAGECRQVGSAIGEGHSIRFRCVRGRDSTDAEIELQRATLRMQEVPEGLDRSGLLLWRH